MRDEEGQMSESSHSAISIVELWEQLGIRDARLSFVETSLKQVRRQVATWSGIVQEGFADIAVHINMAKAQCSRHQRSHPT
mmetsp:Transcript_22228/g.43327  ORF Transcript_22228/g.43327 Transcript_22228/m.43327 type:complete len:81 (+) Transcript_22228:93-335(+)